MVCDAGKLDDAGCKGAPDLIIEILSPSTAKKDRTGGADANCPRKASIDCASLARAISARFSATMLSRTLAICDRSVFEVATPGEDHRQIVFVTGVDHLLVAP